MPNFSSKRRVHHSAPQMFDLVADVERYPEFVPLCRELKVRRRVVQGEGVEMLTADMTVAYKMIHETFTSKVTLDKPRLRILVEYLNGPFRQLENRWIFRPLTPQACEIDFYIAYRFRSRLLERLMGGLFDRAVRKYTDAFEARADAIYGTRSPSLASQQ